MQKIHHLNYFIDLSVTNFLDVVCKCFEEKTDFLFVGHLFYNKGDTFVRPIIFARLFVIVPVFHSSSTPPLSTSHAHFLSNLSLYSESAESVAEL